MTERAASSASLLGGLGGVRLVMNELRSLGVEGRKRNDKALKESAERALMRLQQLEEEHGQNPDAYVAAVRATPDILSPFLLVLAQPTTPLHMIAGFVSSVMSSATQSSSSSSSSSSSPSSSSTGSPLTSSNSTGSLNDRSSSSSKKAIVTGAIGAIQTLVSYGAVAPTALPDVLRALETQANQRSVDDAVLLKLLQAVTAVTMTLTTPTLRSESLPLVRQTLAVVFRIHARKSAVKLAAAATLRQLVVMLFDAGGSREREVLVSDLSSLINQEAPQWLPVDALDSALGLELIESLLLSKTVAVDKSPQNVCPVVFKSQKLATDFPHFVRVQRIILHYVATFYELNPPECEVFLSRQARLLDMPLQSQAPWYHALILEVLARITTANQGLLFYQLYRQFRTTNLVESVVLALGHFVQNMFSWPGDQFVFVDSPSDKTSPSPSIANSPQSPLPLPASPAAAPVQQSSSSSSSSMQRALLGMLSAVDPPDNVSNAYLVSLSLQCLAGICLSCRHCVADDRSFVDASVWPSVLPALALLLTKTVNLPLVKHVLAALTELTDATGALSLATPQQVIITTFVKEIQPTLVSSLAAGLVQQSPLFAGAPPVALSSPADATKWLVASLPAPLASTADSADTPSHDTADAEPPSPPSSGQPSSPPSQSGQAASLDSSGDGDTSSFKYIITHKNMETIGGLFALIQRSGSSLLGETWPIVFDALDLIEKWYTTASAQGDPVGLGMLIGPKQTQLVQHLLASAFHSTADWPTPTLQTLAGSLIQRVLALPGGAAALQPSIGHLYKICSCNAARMDAIWTPALVEAFKKAQATELMIQLIRASCSTSMSDLLLEQLTVLEELARTAAGATLACVQTVLHLIQSSSGAEIDSQCWQLILGLLMNVAVVAHAGADSVNVLNLAFHSLELIVNDFLPSLAQHAGSLALAISTVGCMARQSVLDSNPSLTAIQEYLWNIADLVASDALLSGDGVLWLAVFRELQYLSTDQRHEIRSAAVVTLFKTTSAHAACLSIETWGRFFHDVLFPLLHELHAKSTALYQTDGGNPAEFAMGQDRSVKMLVHHSRDSPAKLWSETCVQAVRHATKLLTAAAPGGSTLLEATLSRLPDFFAAVWAKFFGLLEIYAPHPSKEVSLAAVDCVGEMFCQALLRMSDAHRDQCWHASWLVFEQIAASARRFPAVDCRQRLVTVVEHVLAAVAPLLLESRHDHQRFVRLVAAVYYPHIELPVSKALLAFVEHKLAPLLPALVFEDLLLAVVRLLDAAVRAPPRPDPDPATAATSKYDRPVAGQPTADVSFLLAVMTSLTSEQLFGAAPLAVQALCLPAVVPALASAMQLKFAAPSEPRCGVRSPVWKHAATCLVTLLERHHAALSSVEQAWHPLLSAVEDFLFPSSASLPDDLAFDEAHEEVSYRVRLADLVADTLLPHAPELMVDRLLEVLRIGSTLFDASEPFAAACCRAMFRLCSASNPDVRLTLAHRMTPLLIGHCKATLSAFIADSALLATVPMPVSRLHELLLLLRLLRDLHVLPEVHVVSPNHCLAFPLRKSTRMHLFVLLPTLARCVLLPQQDIRAVVSEIYLIVSEELQL